MAFLRQRLANAHLANAHLAKAHLSSVRLTNARLASVRLANTRWLGGGTGIQCHRAPPLLQRQSSTMTSRAMHSRNAAAEGSLGTGTLPRYPTLEECRSQPTAYHEMSNDVLMMLAASGDHAARTERLIREVIAVDSCSWRDASTRVEQLAADVLGAQVAHRASRRLDMLAVPLSLCAGFASIPLVFSLDVALWFNDLFVTADIPQVTCHHAPCT